MVCRDEPMGENYQICRIGKQFAVHFCLRSMLPLLARVFSLFIVLSVMHRCYKPVKSKFSLKSVWANWINL